LISPNKCPGTDNGYRFLPYQAEIRNSLADNSQQKACQYPLPIFYHKSECAGKPSAISVHRRKQSPQLHKIAPPFFSSVSFGAEIENAIRSSASASNPTKINSLSNPHRCEHAKFSHDCQLHQSFKSHRGGVGWGGHKDKDQGGGQLTSWLGWRGRHGRVGWAPRRGAVGEGAWRRTRAGEELAERGVTG
jgi:hypothetical protein